ncbi:probable rhodanese domain-containing dual specificity protein phosphatase [Eriocheir sinensis]|uniref:probable rhodanese domain-containing dual specificity protein phosphatase n=1 Tax=Eriocheir sinensis TaxID=95602 RepID=UPI0021C7A746|nr:probable rhodanese domain-containing dual specificity protein phosphatase [Eriocheir sinensis]
MGCKGSKSKKNAYARVAQYQKESWAAERAVRRPPEPLDWGLAPQGCITPAALHNMLTDGFYAPYAANPHYLLLVDCRPDEAFAKRRLSSARWHGALHDAPDPRLVNTIVLYDDRPRTATPPAMDVDPLARLYHELRRQKLDPLVLVGGWAMLDATCPHLLEGGEGPPSEPTPWYPAQVVPRQLYLGHAEMAAHPRVLAALRITHIVDVTERLPPRVLPAMNYLLVPVPEDPAAEGDEGGADLLASLPTIMAFVGEARSLGGCVLVHCDQGLTRAAAVVMGILMAERRCTLEDAFYYVKGARSAVHPSHSLLQQLARYETELFGVSLTQAEDLF